MSDDALAEVGRGVIAISVERVSAANYIAKSGEPEQTAT